VAAGGDLARKESPAEDVMNKPSIISELKRRNVFRAGSFYAAGVWLLAPDLCSPAPEKGRDVFTCR
jgi:hypothetical protein